MKKVLLISSLLFLFFGIASSQNACLKKTEPHIRLVGDSWAHFPALYQAYDSALAKYGFPDYYSRSSGSVLISMTAESWWQFPLTKLAMQTALEDDIGKPIDIVMVSLGGNDVAFKIRKGDSLNVLDVSLNKAKLFMDSIFDFIHTTLPNAQVIWQSYDYPNFNDPCIDYPWDPYCDLWKDKGYPSPYEINRFMNYLTDYMDSSIQSYNNPKFHFFNSLGLMQWQYGQTTALRYPPYGTYPPRSVPFPRGNIDYPSPHTAMGLNGIDTYHLGPHSYTVLAEFYMRKYINNYLRRNRDTSFYSAGSNEDGWVTSTGQTGTGEIQIANNGISKTKGIVSFNTSSIPDDKVIKKASLFLRTKSVSKTYSGAVVFPQDFTLDIKQGTFGTSEPEAGDFSETASLSNVACAAGSLRGNEYALRFDLDPQALKFINKTGITQFRLEVLNNNVIKFFNGDTLELEGPYLDIHYDTTAVISGVINKTNTDKSLQVFPNPAKDEIRLKWNKEPESKNARFSIYNTQGKLVWAESYDRLPGEELQINISHLPDGGYIISKENEKDTKVGTFLKLKE
ncbi:MAG: T9SS type A sorting domain-containing protein [Sphingobacteriales bacterium]|nr:T9SS type A sorting domain-containing protein [Sphingobacteriales bacterium]